MGTWLRQENKRLFEARVSGRWEDVTPHFYHRHYTDCQLRRVGALNHYSGKDDQRSDPQAYA